MALQALVTVWPPSLQLNLAKKRDHGLGPLCTMPYPTNGLYLDLQRMLKSRLAAAGSGLCGSHSGEQVRLGIFNLLNMLSMLLRINYSFRGFRPMLSR